MYIDGLQTTANQLFYTQQFLARVTKDSSVGALPSTWSMYFLNLEGNKLSSLNSTPHLYNSPRSQPLPSPILSASTLPASLRNVDSSLVTPPSNIVVKPVVTTVSPLEAIKREFPNHSPQVHQGILDWKNNSLPSCYYPALTNGRVGETFNKDVSFYYPKDSIESFFKQLEEGIQTQKGVRNKLSNIPGYQFFKSPSQSPISKPWLFSPSPEFKSHTEGLREFSTDNCPGVYVGKDGFVTFDSNWIPSSREEGEFYLREAQDDIPVPLYDKFGIEELHTAACEIERKCKGFNNSKAQTILKSLLETKVHLDDKTVKDLPFMFSPKVGKLLMPTPIEQQITLTITPVEIERLQILDIRVKASVKAFIAHNVCIRRLTQLNPTLPSDGLTPPKYGFVPPQG